jgi:23S rRNA (pseudouridine1915-N3)-methyltransferase
MQIHIIATGKIREAYLKEGIEIYRSRLSSRHRIAITDVPEERLPERYSDAEKQSAKEKEGIRLIAAAPQPTVVIALDPGGLILSSDEFSARMARWEIKGQNTLSFFIGSPLGISSAVTRHAELVLSLSRMTFPHQLVRLILIEQIYRADCIRRSIPYHK